MPSWSRTWIGRLSTYLPLIGTCFLLIVTTFNSDVLKFVPMNLMLAIIALSFILLTVHLENRTEILTDEVVSLRRSLDEQQALRQRELDALIPSIRHSSLGDAFADLAQQQRRWGDIRILAISSAQILSFFRFHNFYADKCTLLLRGFPEGDSGNADFANQIKLVVQDWRGLVKSGRLRELEVATYDFLPTEYNVIFGDDLLFAGLYEPDPEDYSGVRVRGVGLIRGSTLEGRAVIGDYTERFDAFYASCTTGKHGSPILI